MDHLVEMQNQLAAAHAKIEGYESALTAEHLGKAISCALREVGDSNHASNAWLSIKLMPDREWIEVLESAIYGLKVQNGIDD